MGKKNRKHKKHNSSSKSKSDIQDEKSTGTTTPEQLKAMKAELRKVMQAAQDKVAPTHQPQGNGDDFFYSLIDDVEKIIALQRAIFKDASDSFPLGDQPEEYWKQKHKAFAQWLKKEAPDSGVDDLWEFSWSREMGTGVRAKKDLTGPDDDPPELPDPVMRIPRSCFMSTDTARMTRLGEFLIEKEPCRSNPTSVLIIHLLYERLNPESRWGPYIDCFPTNFDLPLFWNKTELELLTGSQAKQWAFNMLVNFVRQYFIIHKTIAQANHIKVPPFLMEQFRWAHACVMSRQNQVPHRKDITKQLKNAASMVLIPAWDSCNWMAGPITTDFDVDIDCCLCYSLNDVKAGDPFYISYSSHRDNLNILVHMGFLPEGNENDCVFVRLEITQKDPLYLLKKRLLEKRDMPMEAQFCLMFFQNLSVELLEYLRILVLKKGDAKALMSREDPYGPVSTENEFDALIHMVHLCDQYLSRYPTSLDEDEILLKSNDLSPRKRLAISRRTFEKQILSLYRDKCKEATIPLVVQANHTTQAGAIDI